MPRLTTSPGMRSATTVLPGSLSRPTQMLLLWKVLTGRLSLRKAIPERQGQLGRKDQSVQLEQLAYKVRLDQQAQREPQARRDLRERQVQLDQPGHRVQPAPLDLPGSKGHRGRPVQPVHKAHRVRKVPRELLDHKVLRGLPESVLTLKLNMRKMKRWRLRQTHRAVSWR